MPHLGAMMGWGSSHRTAFGRSFVALSIGIIALATMIFARPVHAELIVNGGFETGDLSGWTPILAANATNVSVNPNNPLSGSFALRAGPLGSLQGFSVI